MMSTLRGRVKEKDLEQLAVVRKYSIKYLIAFDRDFKDIEEYKTPKEFIAFCGLKPSNSDY